MPNTTLKQIEEKLIFAERLAKLINDSFTKEEFLSAYEKVVQLVLALKEQNKKEIESFRKEYEEAKQMYDHQRIINDLSKKLDSYLAETTALVRSRIDTIRDGKDGEDGKDADEDAIAEKVKQSIKIPTIEEIENDLPKLGDRIRDGLELLQGDNRLNKNAIKGLEEMEKNFDEKLSRIPRGRMGMRKMPIVKRYNLSSQTDGSTKTFSLPVDTTDVLGVWSSQFPITYNPLTDWTFAGRTLTLTGEVEAPATGQTLWCLIETLFYS